MSRALTNIAVFCLTLIVLSVVSSTAYAQKWGKVTDEEWQVGPPDDYPEANAVVLFDKCELKVGKDQIVIKYHTRMKVLTRAGVEDIGEQTVWWHKELEKLKGLKAHTITPDGKKHKVEGNQMFEQEDGDEKLKSFAFPALDSGCVVEYRYEVYSKRYHYLKPWYFQNRLYTMKSQLSLTLVAGYSYDLAYQAVPVRYRDPVCETRPDPDNSVMRISKMKICTWTVENMPPIKDEPYMASEFDYRASIKFQLVSYRNSYGVKTYVKNWDELGDEVQRWLEIYCNKDGKVADMAREITAGLTTDREKSRALFDFVKSEYKTSDDYQNKWFVHDKMSQLLEDKYGSAEAKNLLLVKMHRALDIPSWPVLISTRDRRKFNPKFPDLRLFNHLIAFVQLGQQWEFLDASSPQLPYGLLPPNSLTEGGFLIDGKKSDLVKVTIKPAESCRTDTTRMYVKADGTVACSTHCCFTGYYASAYGEIFGEEKPDDFVDDYFIDRLDATCTLGEYHCGLDSADNFVADICYTAEDMVTALDNNLLVAPVSYSFRSNPFKSEKRFFPVDFSYAFTYRNVVEVYVDDAAAQYTPPDNLDYTMGGALFTRSSEVRDSCVVVTSTLKIDEPLFRPSRYKALRAFFDNIALSSEDRIAVALAETE